MLAKRIIPITLFVMAGVSLLHGQLVNGRFVTSLSVLQRFDPLDSSGTFPKKTYLRAFQNVQLSIAQGDVSLHTFIQGAMNGTRSFGDAGRVRFYTLYLSWKNIADRLDLHLGRQSVYAGAGFGTIDGLRARARVWEDKITLVGYGGATVKQEYTGVRKNIHDNFMVGGQVLTTALKDARIGLSYMNRREERDPYATVRARDTLFTAYPYTIANDSPAEEYGSADASYSYESLFSVYGRYDFDFKASKTSRGQGGARVNVTDVIALTADYMYRSPRISSNSIFSVFPSSAVSEIEGGLEYGFTPLLRAFGRIAYVSFTDTSSYRWTLGLNSGYGSVSYSGSAGYAGQLHAVNVQAAYPLLKNMVVPTLGFSHASYRLSGGDARENATSVLLGAIVRPLPAFSFDVQGQWMTNRIYKRDMRLQVKLMYWFAERLSLFDQEVKS